MKWTKLRLKTTTEAVELVGSMLDDLGIEGFEIEDCIPLSEEDKKRMFIDILPELPPDEGIAYLSFYVDPEVKLGELHTQLEEGLRELSAFVNVGEGTLEISETEDTDWINNWKQFFKPFRLDDNIIIKPTWETLSEVKNDDLVIEIDPGTAFGTGSHETTKLCISNLKKYLKNGESLLDVGCGSGILSIIGKKLGAGRVVGIDIDQNAAAISVENTELNSIKSKLVNNAASVPVEQDCINYLDGNVIGDAKLREFIGLGCYDIVVANILADIIIPLSAVAGEFMKPGALFISSGIINTKEEAVKQALVENGFSIVDITKMGDWVSIVAKK